MNKYYCTKCESEMVQRSVAPTVTGYCGECASSQTLRLLRLKGQSDPVKPVVVVPTVETTVRTDNRGTKLDQMGSGIGLKVAEVSASVAVKPVGK